MSGPLSGLKVVDVSIMAAGPWIGTLLGQLGAEVIKIEPPAGDGTRWVEPKQNGMGTNFMCLNLNKKDIILDFKKNEDRDIALKLIAGADIFIQNLRVGVIDRLGLGYEAVNQVNPKIIYCSVSGFGEKGTMAKEACADFIMQAYSGFANTNGHEGESLEAFRFTGFIDLTTSIVAIESILAALIHRQKTALGQKVEVSMLQASLEMQYTQVSNMLNTRSLPRPLGSSSQGLSPDGAFKTLDAEIFLTVFNEEEWSFFCDALEIPELKSDIRFSNNIKRVENRKSLNALVNGIMARRPSVWWLRVLERKGVACAIAQSFEQIKFHSQVQANEMIKEVKTEKWGNVYVGGMPWHFARTPGEITPPPVPGGDTQMVLDQLKLNQFSRDLN